MDAVEEYLSRRFAENAEVRDCLTVLYQQFREWGLKDGKFDQDFTDGADDHFYAYTWEMVLARHLVKCGLEVSSADEGPDFKVPHKGSAIWIEAICPSPVGIPDDWLNFPSSGESRVGSVPHEAMLLRWTSALKEKKEKLTGRVISNRGTREEIVKPGYLQNGIVGERDPYVIAISACRLGYGNTMLHTGISQFPFAVEAAFPVGPVEIVIDRMTMKQLDRRHSHRASIKKPNGADVPTDSFLNPAYSGVSAILGTPAGINAACGDRYPVALVHNPLAANKLPVGVICADAEYVAEDKGDYYELRNVSDKSR
jgi:hypothetical protein